MHRIREEEERHLEIWCLLRRGLVSGSLVPGVWVPLAEYCPWVLREMLPLFGRNAWIDCEFMFCISTGRFMDELHNFYVEWT